MKSPLRAPCRVLLRVRRQSYRPPDARAHFALVDVRRGPRRVERVRRRKSARDSDDARPSSLHPPPSLTGVVRSLRRSLASVSTLMLDRPGVAVLTHPPATTTTVDHPRTLHACAATGRLLADAFVDNLQATMHPPRRGGEELATSRHRRANALDKRARVPQR